MSTEPQAHAPAPPSENGALARSSPVAPAPAAGRSVPAWKSRRAWVILIVCTLLSLGLDLASKEIAFRTVAGTPVVVDREEVLSISRNDPRMVSAVIPRHDPVVVIPGVLHFTLVLNPGAVFGVGPGKRLFFVGFTLLALGFGIGMFALWSSAKDRAAHAAIGMLIGGGLGNLYDRLAYGCVRDFLHPLPGWKWPGGWQPFGSDEIWPYVSNVADALLLIGILILMVHLWRRDKQAQRQLKAQSN